MLLFKLCYTEGGQLLTLEKKKSSKDEVNVNQMTPSPTG